MDVLFEAASKPEMPDLSPAIETIVESLFGAFVASWPLWLLLGLAALGKFGYQLYRLRRLSNSGIADVDRMDGKTFEEFLGTVFRRLGYEVEITRYRGDYGADLVVSKARLRTAVQAKRWSKPIGVKAVQEAVAAKGFYNCEAAMVVANREFTEQARRLAQANDVELWDRQILVTKLLAVRGQAAVGALEPALTGQATELSGEPQLSPVAVLAPDAGFTTIHSEVAENGITAEPSRVAPPELLPQRDGRDVCASCGVEVSAKVRDYCLARPSRFGGRIYCFKDQRGIPPAAGQSAK